MRADQINSADYAQQLQDKVTRICSQFSAYTSLAPDVFESAPLHYRQRAEFRVWHDGDDLYHIMFDAQTKQKYRVDQYPVADKAINRMMAALMEQLIPNPVLRSKLFQIDYLSTLSGDMLITLIYHRQLDDEWIDAANILKRTLSNLVEGQLHIIGRARKQIITLDRNYVLERLPVNDKVYEFKQIENSFTQPNAEVNSKMIAWALEVTQGCKGDLLELYCGLGNFSLPLAQNFDRVLATEISKPSVAAAHYNIQQNGIGNVTILRMSSEEFTQAMRKEKQFSRLKDINLDDYQCNTVLVDPPRAGLDDDTLKMVSEYEAIVYISCNPDTLADNLASLSNTHEVKRFALFDQFPYTHHIETGVFLTKKP